MAIRYGLVGLIALNVFISYADRANLSITISTMEQDTNMLHITSNKGIIFGVFYVGYALSQAYSGYLIRNYGPKWTLFGACLVWSLCEMCTVFAAHYLWSFLLLRVVLGAGEGLALPAIHIFVSRFMLKNERPTVNMISQVFCYAGNIAAYFFAPILLKHSWELVFVLFGAVGLLWLVPWFIFSSTTPQESKWMSETEKIQLFDLDRNDLEEQNDKVEQTYFSQNNSRARFIRDDSESIQELDEFESVYSLGLDVVEEDKYCKLLKCKPLYATAVAQFASGYTLYMFMNFIVLYLEDQYKFSNQTASNIAIGGSAAQCLVALTCGFLNTLKYSKKVRRNAFQLVSLFGSATSLIACQVVKSKNLSLVSFLAVPCFLIFGTYGVQIIHLDFASAEYSAVAFGIGNTFGLLGGAFGCIFSEYLRKSMDWAASFVVCAGLLIVSAVFWIFWSETEVTLK